ncbi:MAG: uracil phosphoribosyltransferase [Epulopiscium sp.]|nr:uracil phosphoribosyltransferase [Candidatus Epulonipiscium sp.]
MDKVFLLDHPLIQHKVSRLRNKETGSKEFRELVSELSRLICYEATRDLQLEDHEIDTPIGHTTAKKIAGKNLTIIPILRAGLGMVDGMLDLVPTAKVGHIGLYRDPDTLEPVEYYCKLPKDISKRELFVLDPMLATGGSAVAAIQFIKDRGGKDINFLCIIAAPEGLEKLKAAHPDVNIYVACLDKQLDENGYIVPGLGDAGDRLFGTK